MVLGNKELLFEIVAEEVVFLGCIGDFSCSEKVMYLEKLSI